MLYLKKLVRCFLIKAIEHLEYLKTIDEETFLDKLTENTLFWELIYLNVYLGTCQRVPAFPGIKTFNVLILFPCHLG